METNPWFDVRLEDYEAHMAMPGIGQAAMLAREFRLAVERRRPRSVGLVGCAGGNGLGELAGQGVDRVVCVDINPAYLERLSARYGGRLRGLETLCCEVERLAVEPKLDLVFGGLVFEYTRTDAALRALATAIRPGGWLVAMTQMRSAGVATVSPSPYANALAGVGAAFTYVDVDAMTKEAGLHGLQAGERRVHTLESGKAFTVVEYRRA